MCKRLQKHDDQKSTGRNKSTTGLERTYTNVYMLIRHLILGLDQTGCVSVII